MLLTASLPKRLFISVAVLLLLGLFIANVVVLNTESAVGIVYSEWLPSVSSSREQRVGEHVWRKSKEPAALTEVPDEHPIKELMHDADYWFSQYNVDRSKTFKETVDKYRRKYGRHPPPGFKQVCATPKFDPPESLLTMNLGVVVQVRPRAQDLQHRRLPADQRRLETVLGCSAG